MASNLLTRISATFDKWEKGAARVEPFLFFGIFVTIVLYMLAVPYFATLDGASHVYNAELINHLLFGEKNAVNDFYEFRTEVLPNWFGHFLLVIFKWFTSGIMAEKLLIATYAGLLVFSFRYVVKTISPENTWFAWLIFPFVFAFTLRYGFYNFSFGGAFMLLCIGYYYKHHEQMTSKKWLVLALLSIALFFSHLLTFVLFAFVIGLWQFIRLIAERKEFKQWLFKNLKFVAAIGLPLLFTALYLLKRHTSGGAKYEELETLWEWFTIIHAIIGDHLKIEGMYTSALFWVIAILLLVCVAGFYLRKERPAQDKQQRWLWWIIAVTLLSMYWLLPNSDKNSGFINIRVQWLFWIFFLIALSTFRVKARWIMIPLFFYGWFYVGHLQKVKEFVKKRHEFAAGYVEAGEQIPAGSVVLNLNNSPSWKYVHISNYLGQDKPLVMFENYELGAGYFPLKWQGDIIPYSLKLSAAKKPTCASLSDCLNEQAVKYNYVVIGGSGAAEKDSVCNAEFRATLERDFELVGIYEVVELWKNKEN